MEKVIFPMEIVSISQLSYGKLSHMGYEAIDITGKDTGIDSAFAPTTCKVLKIIPGESNTVLFGTCDKNGDEAKVLMATGNVSSLTFAFTHDNDIGDIHEGQIFRQFDKIYDEGMSGWAKGNHIHVEVCIGWVNSKSTKRYEPRDSEFPNHAFTLDGPLIRPEKVFFLLKGKNTIGGNYGLNGADMYYTSTANTDDDILKEEDIPLKMFSFKENYIKSDIPNGVNTKQLYIGSICDVIDLYKWKASDGYRWGWGVFDGVAGYIKYDPSRVFLFGKPRKILFMQLEKSAAWLRKSPLGEKITLVPRHQRIMVLEFLYEISEDKYRWVKGIYDGKVGYIQYDPEVMYPTTEK